VEEIQSSMTLSVCLVDSLQTCIRRFSMDDRSTTHMSLCSQQFYVGQRDAYLWV